MRKLIKSTSVKWALIINGKLDSVLGSSALFTVILTLEDETPSFGTARAHNFYTLPSIWATNFHPWQFGVIRPGREAGVIIFYNMRNSAVVQSVYSQKISSSSPINRNFGDSGFSLLR